MDRPRFILSSDQLELLAAFEQSRGLADLAERMAKDPSVISKNLQRLAEDAPVLAKVGGRWTLTEAGRRMNAATKEFLETQMRLLKPAAPRREACHSDGALLLVINAQAGLLDESLGGRSNGEAEKNIGRLLAHWRGSRRPVFHVKHVSENPRSLFHRGSPGAEFLSALAPLSEEPTLEKSRSSAFAETELRKNLESAGTETLILTGFTANDCIDATAKEAAELGFNVYVAGDATAMFDLRDLDGKLIPAERVHRLTMANLNALCAKVVTSDFLLGNS